MVYNVACAAGWGYILLECIRHIVAGSDPDKLYGDVAQVLQIVQSAAIMEVRETLCYILLRGKFY